MGRQRDATRDSDPGCSVCDACAATPRAADFEDTIKKDWKGKGSLPKPPYDRPPKK